MFKSNLLKLIFLTSFVQSDPYFSDIEYFNESHATQIKNIMEDIKKNIPIQDSWTKNSEYQELFNAYKKNVKPFSRTYKIKIPINVGSCSYSGVCFDVEDEVLKFNRLESYLREKIYTREQTRYNYNYNYNYYDFKKFSGKNKLSIPRDFLKDKFDNLTLNAYVKFNIKDLVFEKNDDIIEIIDVILSDQNNNITLSTNFSYLTELKYYTSSNGSSEIDSSLYIKDSMELKLVDVGDISEVINKSKKPKKARVLQSSTAEKMAKVYEALEEVDEKGEPAPDMQNVISILTELRDNIGDLKSYDRSVMWNAWAYVYFYQDKYDQAIQSYKYLIVEPEVTLGLRNSALYSLAQLNIVQENYTDAIKLLLLWMEQTETVTAASYHLLAQAYFFIGYYESAIDSINFAISLAKEEGYEPSESWYNILDESSRLFENVDETDLITPEPNFKAGGSFFRDGEYIPLFKVVPIYPRRAQERGTMGYVIVEFTITETGSVENVKTIEGYCSSTNPNNDYAELRPCTMFNSASSRAALKLKYKPKIVDGKAVPVEGVIHRFTYILDES